MFDKYSAVTSEDKYPFLDYREIVLARKKPRDVFVQANTIVESKLWQKVLRCKFYYITNFNDTALIFKYEWMFFRLLNLN